MILSDDRTNFGQSHFVDGRLPRAFLPADHVNGNRSSRDFRRNKRGCQDLICVDPVSDAALHGLREGWMDLPPPPKLAAVYPFQIYIPAVVPPVVSYPIFVKSPRSAGRVFDKVSCVKVRQAISMKGYHMYACSAIYDDPCGIHVNVMGR